MDRELHHAGPHRRRHERAQRRTTGPTPDHYKNFTIVGILLMALLMGLGGGITRDVMLNQVPGALTNPAYITVCVIARSSSSAASGS